MMSEHTQQGVGSRCRLCLRAYTLLEVLIVLSLLVLLASMAWPLVQSQILASELPESASRMRETLYMTRSAAMLEHRRHRIRFAPGKQQPIIEVELDPILRPGEWVHCTYPWTREPILLKDVQVHGIFPGRPDYLKPVSATEDAGGRTREKEAQRDLSLDVGVTAGQQIGSIGVATANDQAELDPQRPPIVFETNGSSDWATIVLARILPEEAIDEQALQLWVVLDGRTGLARVQEQITQAQLADPGFYVQREKLELPDVTSTKDLSLTITTDEAGNLVDPTSMPSGQAGIGGTGGMGRAGGGMTDPSQGGLPGQGGIPPVAPPAVPEQAETRDEMEQLEEQLADSDLSDEEKEEIRRNFRSGGRPR